MNEEGFSMVCERGGRENPRLPSSAAASTSLSLVGAWAYLEDKRWNSCVVICALGAEEGARLDAIDDIAQMGSLWWQHEAYRKGGELFRNQQ